MVKVNRWRLQEANDRRMGTYREAEPKILDGALGSSDFVASCKRDISIQRE
jgi:hypothetical protein